ncbi:MAG: DUF167 domain-containing protein [Chloroflexi bacterium]|nr:DUF167 domain-containing protein [Chloroflexota bacterium]
MKEHPANGLASAIIAVKVVPRASQNRVEGWHGDALKVRLTAPPVEGKANAALIALLAKALHIRQGNVDIIGGETSRLKRVRISGLSADDIRARLGTG